MWYAAFCDSGLLSKRFDSSTSAAPGGGAEDDGTTLTTESVEDTTPTTEPPNLLLPVAVAVANNHGCTLNAVGGTWCWGSASKGVLGNGLTSGTFASPTQVLAGVPFKTLDLSDTPQLRCRHRRAGLVLG